MIHSTHVGLGQTTDSIDNLSEQQGKSSVKANTGQIQHLTPAGGLQGSRSRDRAMQAQIDDAAHQASTSKNPRYNALLVLKARDYRNAPGNSISLTTGGLAGGTPDEAREWLTSLSSEDRVLLNQFKTNASSILDPQQKERGRNLNREHARIYAASDKQNKGGTSGQSGTSSSRPTTGQLRLKESDMKKYYGYRDE